MSAHRFAYLLAVFCRCCLLEKNPVVAQPCRPAPDPAAPLLHSPKRWRTLPGWSTSTCRMTAASRTCQSCSASLLTVSPDRMTTGRAAEPIAFVFHGSCLHFVCQAKSRLSAKVGQRMENTTINVMHKERHCYSWYYVEQNHRYAQKPGLTVLLTCEFGRFFLLDMWYVFGLLSLKVYRNPSSRIYVKCINALEFVFASIFRHSAHWKHLLLCIRKHRNSCSYRALIGRCYSWFFWQTCQPSLECQTWTTPSRDPDYSAYQLSQSSARFAECLCRLS